MPQVSNHDQIQQKLLPYNNGKNESQVRLRGPTLKVLMFFFHSSISKQNPSGYIKTYLLKGIIQYLNTIVIENKRNVYYNGKIISAIFLYLWDTILS